MSAREREQQLIYTLFRLARHSISTTLAKKRAQSSSPFLVLFSLKCLEALSLSFLKSKKIFNNFIREEEEILALGLADPYPEVRSVWTLASSSF